VEPWAAACWRSFSASTRRSAADAKVFGAPAAAASEARGVSRIPIAADSDLPAARSVQARYRKNPPTRTPTATAMTTASVTPRRCPET
jgi:hypothetical protein